MKIYTLKTRQQVSASRDEVFGFFERPENVQAITPPELGFQILTPSPICMGVGRLIEYRLRLLGLSVRWRTLISTYDPPREFVDEQIRGPYSFWHHRHRFEASEKGTLIFDEVHYAVPLSGLGRGLHALWVRPHLRRIFEFRGRVIGGLFDRDRVLRETREAVLVRFGEVEGP